MRALLHAAIAWLMEPAHVRLRDRVAFWATTHVPAVASMRRRWAARRGRPGWRPSDYR